jgi:hypothetical protein
VKPKHTHGLVVSWCVVLFALVPSMYAQQTAASEHIGYPQDWSTHHIVFSRDGIATHPDIIDREPRILPQAMQRWQASKATAVHGAKLRPVSEKKTRSDRDWNELMGGRPSPNMFPAKYSFDPAAAPDCTNDYVVFGLSVSPGVGVGGGVANLVAFNNLYSGSDGGICDATDPTVLFAYNITTVTGGRISTSPILSLDGKKVAFIESVPGATPQALFHVVTWHAGDGQIGGTGAAVPGSMTTLSFSATVNSTTSSPWIDYNSDTAYLGADTGLVYKITGVFNGTPTLAGAPWPVAAGATRLSPPVLDASLGILMVGSASGNVYQIDTTTGVIATVIVGANAGTTPGIVAPPIVDVSNGTTFVVTANAGAAAELVEFDTASLTQLSFNELGVGSSGGTALRLYEPAFSNSYFDDPSTGVIRICGTGTGADTSPWEYEFGFSGRFMLEANQSGFPAQIVPSTAARCTGLTEFFNPGVSGGTDFFFFGLTQDCTGIGNGFTDGCVMEFIGNGPTIQAQFPALNGGPSGIVVDNFSTDLQASSFYFAAARSNIAYKLTQVGLQ